MGLLTEFENQEHDRLKAHLGERGTLHVLQRPTPDTQSSLGKRITGGLKPESKWLRSGALVTVGSGGPPDDFVQRARPQTARSTS
jgi:hypothetical protein